LKSVLGFVINGVAVVTFIVARAVYWKHGIIMIAGGILGGYLGAHYAQKLPQSWIRRFVVLVGAGMTVYFFWKSYSKAGGRDQSSGFSRNALGSF